MLHKAARRQCAAAAAGQDDGQVVMRVAIAVRVATAIDDHRIVQERFAVHVLCVLHFIQKLGELLRVPKINLFELLDFFRIVLVMRQIVMPFRHADVRERFVAAVMSQQESGDAG